MQEIGSIYVGDGPKLIKNIASRIRKLRGEGE